MNLAIALLRMAPNRFQSNFKKIYHNLGTDNEERCLKALYFLIVKGAKIENMNAFIKDKNDKVVILPEKEKKKVEKKRAESLKPIRDGSVSGSYDKNPPKGSIRISRVLGLRSNSSKGNFEKNDV